MTKFWSFFLHKRSFTLFLIGMLLLAGLYSVISLPKEATPDISIPLGIVSTALPGASAADVERLVTDKIETGVLGVEHVSKVTSTSADGFSSVSVEFDSSANIDKSIQALKDAVDKVKPDLPEEATTPVVSDVNFADSPVLEISISGDLAPGELTQLGDTVSDEIKRVPGVAKVSVSGVRAREVQVIAHEAALQQFGISLSDVTAAIRAAGVASPAGTLTIDNVNYAVRFEDLVSTDQVRNVVITTPTGTTVRLADVADVVDGLQNPSTYSRVSVAGEPSQPSLTLTVFKTRGGNIVKTGKAVLGRLDELQGTTLAGTKTVVSYNGAEEVNKSLTELTRAGVETVLLVMLVLYLTLGLRESLVAAASVPLSFLIAFIGLLASGNSLNNVSLFALILAIGILVDSGVVMVEAYHTRLRKLNNRTEAAVQSIREYAGPLTAGTFTTIAVFIPLFFLTGIVGKFLASIPFTLIFVLLASIFVALGFVPFLTVLFVKEGHSATEDRAERINAKAKSWYIAFLHRFLHDRKGQNRFLLGMIALFFIALSLPATGLLKSIFFPSANGDFFYVQVEMPQGTSLEKTDLAMREVEEILYQDKGIASFVTQTGSGSSFSNTTSFSGAGSGSNIGNITVNLPKGHKLTSAAYVERVRKELVGVTDASVTVGEAAGGPPSASPVTVTFTGEDLNELTATADRAAHTLSDIPGVVNVSSGSGNTGAEFVVSLDSGKAAAAGVSPVVVADTLRSALFGTKATSIRTGKNDIDVYTKLDLNPDYKDPSQTTHATIDSIRALTFPTKTGPVPLSSIATVSYEPAQGSITHEAGDRNITVTGDVTSGTNAVSAENAFQKKFTDDQLGKGVTMKIGGASADIAQSFTQLFFALIAGAALMLAILVLEFNSFRLSFYLLSIIPLSLVGVFVGLALVGQPLSLPSMLGVIALAGVIINHAIILMDSIARIHREQPGLTHEDVVIEAASTRLRPILLTTIVTVIGMIPLALVDPFWAPLAVAIMFGLAFSLLLTLLLIPMLYFRWPGKAVQEARVG